MNYRVGIVGATGVVGQELIELLHRRNFPMESLTLLASSRSAGKTITFEDKSWTVQEARPEAFDALDIAIFSAGGSTSKELCPEAAKRGCIAIDNSSTFRLDSKVPLIVPEINTHALAGHENIIANPNCSTAVALMGLYPLHQRFGLKRYVAATYQAVSGAGIAAMHELEQQMKDWAQRKELSVQEFPHQIAFNLFPHVDVFYEDGYTKEEHKMLNESRKILELPELKASTTCVRVPVLRAHSIALNAEFEKPVDLAEAREAINTFAGAELCDEPGENRYPMPLDYSGKEACGVGRLRLDSALDNGLALWVVGDQLWKGAALNAVQIAEALAARSATV
ncbi:MAG: aspartate-semialdehyde dehydrogenase [Verrucomicrobiota bacterium]